MTEYNVLYKGLPSETKHRKEFYSQNFLTRKDLIAILEDPANQLVSTENKNESRIKQPLKVSKNLEHKRPLNYNESIQGFQRSLIVIQGMPDKKTEHGYGIYAYFTWTPKGVSSIELAKDIRDIPEWFVQEQLKKGMHLEMRLMLDEDKNVVLAEPSKYPPTYEPKDRLSIEEFLLFETEAFQELIKHREEELKKYIILCQSQGFSPFDFEP